MVSYKAVDRIVAWQIEPNDIVRLPDGQEVFVTNVSQVDNGYKIYFPDLFGEVEDDYVVIGEDDYVDLLIPDYE